MINKCDLYKNIQIKVGVKNQTGMPPISWFYVQMYRYVQR